jgi:hypothetical protein
MRIVRVSMVLWCVSASVIELDPAPPVLDE